MKTIPGGVCAPAGFRASGVAAKIKGPKSVKRDCALIVSGEPAVASGTFTTNLLKAPPIVWTEAVCGRGAARAIFANSGNANACTGAQGAADARTTAAAIASGLGIREEEVCVLSTGVIGQPLPMDRILEGVAGCLAGLSPEGSAEAANAIMTTDTVPKEMAVEVQLSCGAVRIGAIAKGSGMIAPNMATMFCLITTDATIAATHLRPLLFSCVDASFNSICVDNDMSTSDAVICLANGAAKQSALQPGTPNHDAFAKALAHVCREMAQALVRDGEGATKFIEIAVDGALTCNAAKTIARSIAASQLCKTAFFGQDPNWGRIACAAGYAGTSFDPNQLSIWLGDLMVMENGVVASYLENEAARIMRARDIQVKVTVGDGPGHAVYWTSDLSHDYVSINADYRS